MGATSSSLSDLADNEYLIHLSGTDVLSINDPFWNQLLSFSIDVPTNSADQRLLDESTAPLCKQLAINNCHTGNLGALVRVFLTRATELTASTQCEDNIFTWQTYNAVFIIRNICKYMVENLSEEVVLEQFNVLPPNHPDGVNEQAPLIEQLLNSVIEILVDVPLMEITYSLHLESINLLVGLLSIQIFRPIKAHQSHIYKCIMTGKCSIHAPLLTKVLLLNYVKRETCPEKLLVTGHRSGHSMLYNLTTSLAASLWSVMTLGMGQRGSSTLDSVPGIVLCHQSLILLLILTNHCTSEDVLHNPYRQALFNFLDEQESSGPTAALTFKAPFHPLYETMCKTLHDDQVTLLLYLLLHQNPHVRAFVLSRTTHEQLVIPLLQVLYHAQDSNSHHIYMALIILLMLSEDEDFNKEVHEVQLKNITWFKERHIKEISLGGLIILILIRTVQFNMTRMKDKYLHTNCLAALANMSSTFKNLHPYVAQRIVSLFNLLLKKHNKMVDVIRDSAISGKPSNSSSNSSSNSANDDPNNDPNNGADDFEYVSTPSQVEELAILEEVIRMVLEIINSTLTHALSHNVNLVYTLLYQRHLFTIFKNHPTFQDVIQNIETVLSFFSSRLEQGSTQISVSEVHEVIIQGMVQFRKDKLKKFPELKFKYVEEECPEEFFVPYVWSLVYGWTSLHFNPSRIQIFTVQTSEELQA